MVQDGVSFDQLSGEDDFVGRHIGPDDAEIAEMLAALGYDGLDALTTAATPQAILSNRLPDLAPAMSERAVLDALQGMAAKNRAITSLIGMGYYGTVTPPVIRRRVIENPGWYTAYTPYQPEISQGRLEALLNFQTMVSDLTGLDIANASMLDEGTAAAEAMTLAHRLGKSKSDRFFVASDCHPQTIAVVETRAAPLGIELVVGDPATDLANMQSGSEDDEFLGVLLQYPNTFGEVADYRDLVDRVHAAGGLVVVATDLLALTLLTPPGEWGADIAVGNSQRFGVPMMFGGPHAAFFATRDEFKRSLPGRLVGVSIDSKGRPALRLALQTREQHIRREKATSNICTAQVLLAVVAALYAQWHGPEGLTRIARRVHRLTSILAQGLRARGFEVENSGAFDTLTVATNAAAGEAEGVLSRARAAGFNLRRIDAGRVAVSFDETSTLDTVARLLSAFDGAPATVGDLRTLDDAAPDLLPAGLVRRSPFLTHPVFALYRSETEMMRYLHRLARKDLALDTAMIPLGSCTMKLNAASEMESVTWPEFANVHPFTPADQVAGFTELIEGLETQLARITGFAAVSLQPNAGSQGEYSGLLVIRAWHASRGEAHRDICLIPSSAHGTNPASAVLAGMKVVVVGCDEAGNIDVEDLKAKAAQHADRLAALMVTYPSTHGVFEEAIVEICDIVHAHGGQVYMDGANMNALIGLAEPGCFGPDVMHLNLHKTFCIPHGGGGPGVGPIAVSEHLAPYLPGHPLRPDCGGRDAIGPVSAAPWGSAGILQIPWAYISLMGAAGLRRATQVAILNANYIARRLAPHFPVLYTGKNGLVAHECIVDLRPLKKFVSVDDVAKRLIDYGFHAPTMSFPVAGTLMIEPTESESKAEIDRFCDAMIAIRAEIAAIEEGAADATDNVLANAPHTAEDLASDDWQHSYPRSLAAYPVGTLRDGKYWSPVSRIDNVYGDRNIVCACPPLDSYREAAE